MISSNIKPKPVGYLAKEVFSLLLDQNQIFLSKRSLQQLLEKHDTTADQLANLNRLCADVGLRLDAVEGDVAQLSDVTFPCIAINQSAPALLLLIAADAKEVTYLSGDNKRQKLTLSSFADQWSGFLLIPEKMDWAGDKNYDENRKKEKTQIFNYALLLLLLLVAATTLYVAIDSINYFLILLVLLKSIGLFLSAQLSQMEIAGNADGLFSKVCNTGKRFSCKSVIDSAAAKIFGDISMADVGLVYFSGGLLASLLGLLSGQLQAMLSLLAILSWAALPYTLFSIIYQARVVKQWCVLCLLVQGLLWLEAFVLIVYFSAAYSWPNEFWVLGTMAFSFALTLLSWTLLKPLFLQLNKLQAYPVYYHQLARFPAVFSTVISQQPKYPHQLSENELVMGSNKAPVQLTLILSTFCPHCAEAFRLLQELPDLYPDQLYIGIRLISPPDSPLAPYLLQLSLEGRHSEAFELLADWYQLVKKKKINKQDEKARMALYQQWQAKHQIRQMPGPEAVSLFDQSIRWIYQTGQHSAPVFFVNHYLWPNDLYDWKDIRYYIEELEELEPAIAS